MVSKNLWQGHQSRFDWSVAGVGIDHHGTTQSEGRGALYLCDDAAVFGGV